MAIRWWGRLTRWVRPNKLSPRTSEPTPVEPPSRHLESGLGGQIVSEAVLPRPETPSAAEGSGISFWGKNKE
jgi:hypothetical protein